jgi:phosphoribosylamine--glycine ligase
MTRKRIPTAGYRVVDSADEAVRLLRSGKFGSRDSQVVVKADGLAAGKGVVVATSQVEAEQAVSALTNGELVGKEASRQLLIEEALEGREASILLFADGRDYALMPTTRDHKRIGENDTGPNTGGMGAITDSSILDEPALDRIVNDIVEPTLEGAYEEGFPFRGVLFIGLMLTADGPKVLEYNVRFGDPETQAILVRLESDLLQIFEALRNGELRNVKVEWSQKSSACVVLASGGYPGTYETGIPIHGLNDIDPGHDLQVFHAGTTKSEAGEFLTAGGRVLGVTAAGETLNEALDRSYASIRKISWEGMQYRRDIGRFQETLKATNG